MTRRMPWVRALVYPLQETTVITRPGFVRTDLLANLSRNPDEEPPPMHRPDLELGGVRLTTPRWALERGVISEVRNLRWWELADPVTGSQVSGYTVQPYLVPRSNRMQDDVIESVGENDPLPIEWRPATGGRLVADYWETCMPDAEPQTHAIAWRGTDRDDFYMAVTDKLLPAGQSFAVRLWFLGTAPVFSDDEDEGPFLDFVWGGGTWSVHFPLLRPPALCRRENGEWVQARSFGEFGTDLFSSGEPTWLRVFHVAGRLVVEIETASGQRAQVVYTETREDQFGVPQMAPMQVPRGRASLSGRGVAFSAQLHEYWWGRWVEESVDEYGMVTPAHFDATGSFSRRYTCNRRVSANALTAVAFGYHANGTVFGRDQLVAGSAGSVATVTDEPVLDTRNRSTGFRKYTCTLQAHNPPIDREWLETSEVSMAGATTPFVYGVAVRVGSSRVRQSSAPIDIRPALERVTEDLADPALQAGPAWTLTINRSLLPEAIHQDTGNPVGAAWTDYVQKYHRIDVDVSWQCDDGTLSAGTPPDGAGAAQYVRRLIGFIDALAPQADRFGDYGGTITARDFGILLQPPAGIVDGRFAPLDLLLHEKAATGTGRRLMGWEAVRYILETALGPDIAAELVHMFPDDHYDLLAHRLLLDPPQGGFFFPPPWGQSAYQWIQQLAERDFAVFFWAADPDDWTQVVPHYCNYYTFLENAPEVVLPDALYGPGDADELLQGAGSRHDPRQDFNRVLVWGAPPGQGNLGGVMPTLQAFSAEARIEDGSPIPEQNIDSTWERTKLLRGSHFWLGRVARIVALNTARLVRGVDQRGISLLARGNPYLWWGWKVRPQMSAASSDPYGLNLNGELCRVIRVRNDILLSKGRFETRLRVAPEPEA